MKKRVYVAHTGGTVGMKPTEGGYAPEPGFLEQRLRELPELAREGMPEVVLREYSPLLDSANMTPETWMTIARDIVDRYDEFDGFVILHGTDTMAYTASALPFMLQGLRKPVVLTGSQIPLCEIRNDARDNIITSLLIAAHHAVPEVCLCFGNRLLRGCRSVKVNASGFRAFASPNYPPLGRAGIRVVIQWDLVLPPPPEDVPLHVVDLRDPQVAALRLFPGISAEIVDNMLQSPLKGIVLEAYGVGNGPATDRRLMEVLEGACRRGVLIVDCTQCLKGGVDLDGYATGTALRDIGIISGFDMTAEAALAKMFYLFKQGLDEDSIRMQMQENLRGELTRSPRS